MTRIICLLSALLLVVTQSSCTDVTHNVFGGITDGMPAAFGDFNSDELTDVFVLRNNGHVVEILLAHDEEPLLRPSTPTALKCTFKDLITSVVPGDFDGDALMDVLVTTISKVGSKVDERKKTSVHLLWGGANHLNCSNEEEPMFKMYGQPLAIDCNQDMIIDLFGVNEEGKRMFWIFGKTRSFTNRFMDNAPKHELQYPHAHAYLDLNDDFMADLFITTKENFEIWSGQESNESFVFKHTIAHPISNQQGHIGQSLFIDIELIGRMDLITPVCSDYECKNSTLLVHINNTWHNLDVNFKDNDGNTWRFFKKDGSRYTNAITLHSGDFNMDGYPDVLTVLHQPGHQPQAFFLENSPCTINCGVFKRTFVIKWNALYPFKNGTVMAAFFDFYQDGILDVIMVQHNGTDYKALALKNSLDYDANFVKVMVLTGLSNNAMTMGRVGKKRRTYGTNLPGPRISYHTTTQEGNPRHAVSAQMPQSAHFSLNLPYTIFGLGRTPNFVDFLCVGLSNHSREWTQIIPNSQMVVIPWPPQDPSSWRAQLFVTPSKLILMSVAALTVVCGLITAIILALHYRERQEDKKERLSESHRFHFDAM